MRFKQDSWDFVGGFGDLSRDMLAAMLDQSTDCVKILDGDGRVDFLNRHGRQALELEDALAVLGRPWAELWPEESRDKVLAAVAAAQRGEAARLEGFCPTALGTPKWWDVSVTPVRDGDGALFAILALSRDVTERHRAMETLETMAHEMRHRLRNAYAVSGAIAVASGREEPEHGDFASALAQRLNALSAVQSGLIDPAQEQSIAQVVDDIVGAFGAAGLVEVADLPEIVLGEQATRLVALTLGELATNSLKHGALLSGRPVRLSAAAADGTLTLIWREDDGAARTASEAREGSGHRLIARMARAHGGSFGFERSETGCEARLVAPIER